MGSLCTDNKFHGSFYRLRESTHAVLKSSRQKVMKSNKIKMIKEEARPYLVFLRLNMVLSIK